MKHAAACRDQSTQFEACRFSPKQLETIGHASTDDDMETKAATGSLFGAVKAFSFNRRVSFIMLPQIHKRLRRAGAI